MLRSLVLVSCLCLALPAAASRSQDEAQLPPLSFTGMTFQHPNGCVYSRADPPGGVRSWHAIANAQQFFPGARPGNRCTPTLFQPR
ncbi:MAG: hypothetical protein JJT81_07505 [Rubellimicrobium sp.]|nr:hypothetical protein [Rubellimicrobium sp.]